MYRDDPKRGRADKRSGTAWIVGVGVAVGVVLGLGLGAGLGADFAFVGAFGKPKPIAVSAMSGRERFRLCSVTDAEADPVPTPEELEAMLARRQALYAEPKWGTP